MCTLYLCKRKHIATFPRWQSLRRIKSLCFVLTRHLFLRLRRSEKLSKNYSPAAGSIDLANASIQGFMVES